MTLPVAEWVAVEVSRRVHDMTTVVAKRQGNGRNSTFEVAIIKALVRAGEDRRRASMPYRPGIAVSGDLYRRISAEAKLRGCSIKQVVTPMIDAALDRAEAG